MSNNPPRPTEPDPRTREFYRNTLRRLHESGVPFLVGGAYALGHYTGIARHTKDLDIFVRPADVPRVLAVLQRAGCRTEVTFEHWLAKAFAGDDLVDIIYNSGNGLCPVDDAWLGHAEPGEVLGVPVRFCPAEEMIWQKSFIMERERFDGADVVHLIRARGPRLDWGRLLGRFGPHWRVLLSQLILFGYVYPVERDRVPAEVLQALATRLLEETRAAGAQDHLCRGTILSREQYLVDVGPWGYRDARLRPEGRMTEGQIDEWTEGIGH
jgi:hypothetical protein